MDDKSKSMGRFRREVEEVLALAKSAPKTLLGRAGVPDSTMIENSEESRMERARREWILEELRGRLEFQARELESERCAREEEVRKLAELRGELRPLREKAEAAAQEAGAAKALSMGLAESVSEQRLALEGWEARGREHSIEAARLNRRVLELEAALEAQEAAGAAAAAALAQGALEAERRRVELEDLRLQLNVRQEDARALRERLELSGAELARRSVEDSALRAQLEARAAAMDAERSRLQGSLRDAAAAVEAAEFRQSRAQAEAAEALAQAAEAAARERRAVEQAREREEGVRAAMEAEVSRLKAEMIRALEATRAAQANAAASAAASEAERLEWLRREADAAVALGTEGVIDKIKRILGQK